MLSADIGMDGSEDSDHGHGFGLLLHLILFIVIYSKYIILNWQIKNQKVHSSDIGMDGGEDSDHGPPTAGTRGGVILA